MSNFKDKLEIITNLAIILLVIVISAVLIQRYFFYQSNSSAQPQITKGDKIVVADVDFTKAEKTLVLVLSSTCRFCDESAPFYRKILKETANTDIQIVAALPQEIDDSREYLNKLELGFQSLKQISLNEINVRGTPTLILFDNTGTVVNSWVGKLPKEKEDDVLNLLKHKS